MSRRVLVSSLLACAIAVGTASAATAAPAVSHAAAVRALQAAQDVFRSPLASGGSGARGGDATVALRDLAVALPALRGSQRSAAEDLLARPTDTSDRNYFGPEAAGSPICNTQFCVHWTDKASNAPVDAPFITQILTAMNFSYSVENTSLGWKDAKSDGQIGKRNGVGGEGQVDVYVTNLPSNLYGYASPDGGQRGGKRYAYLVLDNDYTGFPTPPIQSMQVTVAHEYNHILQFNYDVYQDTWLFEATATWAEEKVYPAINDYLNYVPALAKKPQVPMTGTSIKIYAEAVWNHFLSYRWGDSLIRNVWEVSPSQKHFAVASYDKAIKSAGSSSFPKEFGEFAANTAEWHSSPAFPDQAVYPDVKRSGTLGSKTKKTTLDNTAYRLYNVTPSAASSITLKVKAEKGTKSEIALVGRQGADPGPVLSNRDYLTKGGKGSVTLDNPGIYSRITAVIVNVDGRSTKVDKKGKRVYKSDGSKYKFSIKG